MKDPITTEPTQSTSPARSRLRAAIDRAIARRAALELQHPPAGAPAPFWASADAAAPADNEDQDDVRSSAPATPDLPVPPRSLRQDRYRDAANRAANRERVPGLRIPASGTPRAATADPVEAASLGRVRSRARPRPRDSQKPLAAPAAAEALTIAQPAEVRREAAQPEARPTPLTAALHPEELAPPELRRPPLWLALLAGCGWTALLVWLIVGRLTPETAAATRLIYGGMLVALGLLTWVPIQWATRLPMLTWRGTVGLGIVMWTLAFVPPPTQRIVAGLPDLPVYLLFFSGAFLASNAIALPFTYVRGIRRYHNRAERFDVARARRQAAEVGLFCTLCLLLAAMNVLELVTVMLLIAILFLSEMVILSLRK